MSILSQLGISKSKWLKKNVSQAKDIKESDTFQYGATPTTVSTSLLGSGKNIARARTLVYEKWSLMESDAICSTALSLLVTSALGGNDTTGQVVFIEKSSIADNDKQISKMVDEISSHLTPMLNKIAFSSAYTGTVFGDAYARIYSDNKNGIVDIYTDELVRSPLIQPYERGSKTIGYAIYTGARNFERLNVMQMARLKMPRTQWIPQVGIIEKSLRLAIIEDDLEKLPILPSMAGGSFLYPAEEAYDNLSSSLSGLVGQRWIDSIDEQILSVNTDGMTKEQRELFLKSLETMLTSSKTTVSNAYKNGRPILDRIRHILPTFKEKQVVQLQDKMQSSRSGNISVEDVLFHAKLLAGALGVDLSMLGFSELLSGGLGDGGFFRTSAQSAERARLIRTSLNDFFNQIIDIHTLKKYGVVFTKKNRPFKVNFYGSISALEAEKENTKNATMNSGLIMIQALQGMKELGASEEVMIDFLSNQLMIDEEQAKMYAQIVNVKDEEQ